MSKNYNTSKKLRMRLYKKYGKKSCHWCGLPLDFEETTLEHFIPQSQGGTYSLENTTIACAACNHERGTTDAWIFHNTSVWLKKRQANIGEMIEAKTIRLTISVKRMEHSFHERRAKFLAKVAKLAHQEKSACRIIVKQEKQNDIRRSYSVLLGRLFWNEAVPM